MPNADAPQSPDLGSSNSKPSASVFDLFAHPDGPPHPLRWNHAYAMATSIAAWPDRTNSELIDAAGSLAEDLLKLFPDYAGAATDAEANAAMHAVGYILQEVVELVVKAVRA